MGAANARAFGLPGVLESAMGYGRVTPIGYDDRAPGKTGGIDNPKPVELMPGESIVRFGSKRLDPSSSYTDHKGQQHVRGTSLSARGLIGSALEGAWWLDAGEFEKIRTYASQQRITIGAAVSALCVVPVEWSDLDIVVTAKLVAPLLAYRGKPNPANVGGTHVPVVRDNAGHAIEQLFIPGLGNPDVVRQALMHSGPVFLHPQRG